MKLLGKIWLGLKKHAPTIGTVLGVGGMMGGTVMACRATRKLDDILEPFARELENEELTDKERAKVKLKAAWALTKLYGPSAAVELASGGLILGCHAEEHGRFVKASVVANGLMAALNTYRGNVKDYIGEDAEQKLYAGYKPDIPFDENEKKPALVELKAPKKPVGASIYARFFDESCPEWQDNAEYNLSLLQARRKELQRRFNHRGYLFLNEVYEHLGMQPTKEGCVVGWIWKKGQSNEIDFGLDSIQTRTSVNEWKEPRILLDFNVDGVIYDKITFEWGNRN